MDRHQQPSGLIIAAFVCGICLWVAYSIGIPQRLPPFNGMFSMVLTAGCVIAALALTVVPFITIVYDHRDLKREKKRASQTDQTFRQALDHYQTIYFRVGLEPSPHHTNANHNAVLFFGYDNLSDFLAAPPEEKYRSVAGQNGITQDPPPVLEDTEAEVLLSTRDGKTHWVSFHTTSYENDAGSIDYIDYFLKDITEQKEREKAIRQRKTEYQTLIETLNVGVYRINFDGTIIKTNAVKCTEN